ncbi:MAG: beta-lactamase family protein [Saprospiraceae bacterium]|nr:beta-lactamase family protein [Saprospiraceae bacterium]
MGLELDTAEQVLCSAFIEYLNKECDGKQGPSMSVAVVHLNRELFQFNRGQRRQGHKDGLVDDRSMYRIGSLSKGFSGILAAMLAERGMISLDDPVSKYIPEFTLKHSSPNDSIRIWHILSHATGLTEHAYTNLIELGKDKTTLIRALSSLDVRDSTGKSYAYQNASFSLIEEVIASVTNMSFEEALQTLLFNSLGMLETTVGHQAMMDKTNKVWPIRNSGRMVSASEIDDGYYNTPSAGGINSNLHDMVIWLKAMQGYFPAQINDEVRHLAFTPKISTLGDDKYYNFWPGVTASFYGLGWRILEMNGRIIIFHGGQVSQYRSEIAFDPQSGYGIVAFFNSPSYLAGRIVPDFFQMVNDISQ